MFTKISNSCSPYQLRNLSFISQCSTDIRYVSGSDNSVADALSKINALNHSTTNCFIYLLTCIDRYTRWQEVIPLSDRFAETMAKSVITNWVSCFGVPSVLNKE
ncbi:hypothetical protein NPIL_341991 [Nephila pilipes]|uniref:Integrase catalytic domain-containing protein n=1 Tax=Nephila pilipes TaxID=299642 RepID=A0A8X6QLK2_NEPPI|nr:hypothetical protein NPIL_341991 [Nephila pilipes]